MKQIKLEGKKIYYQKYNTNKNTQETFLFVHGWGGSSKSLSPIATHLDNFSSYIINLPGFGQSDTPESNWGIEEYGELVAKFIRSLHIAPLTYFGHSFGGTLGIYLATKHPKLIKYLILCAPSFYRSVRKNTGKNQQKQKSKSTLTQIRILAKQIGSILPPLRRLYYHISYPKSDLYKFPKLESNFRKIITTDISGLVTKIKCPTLAIWGRKDKQTPIDNLFLLEKLNTKIKTQIYEYQDHGLPLNLPEYIAKDIKLFLRKYGD